MLAARVGNDRGGPPSAPDTCVGGTVELEYLTDLDGDAFAPAGAARCTLETTPTGDRRRHYFDADGYLLRRVEPTSRDVRPGEGDFVTDYTYDGDGRLVARSLPRGNGVELVYDETHPSRTFQGDLLEVRTTAGTVDTSADLVTRFTISGRSYRIRSAADVQVAMRGQPPGTALVLHFQRAGQPRVWSGYLIGS